MTYIMSQHDIHYVIHGNNKYYATHNHKKPGMAQKFLKHDILIRRSLEIKQIKYTKVHNGNKTVTTQPYCRTVGKCHL